MQWLMLAQWTHAFTGGALFLILFSKRSYMDHWRNAAHPGLALKTQQLLHVSQNSRPSYCMALPTKTQPSATNSCEIWACVTLYTVATTDWMIGHHCLSTFFLCTTTSSNGRVTSILRFVETQNSQLARLVLMAGVSECLSCITSWRCSSHYPFEVLIPTFLAATFPVGQWLQVYKQAVAKNESCFRPFVRVTYVETVGFIRNNKDDDLLAVIQVSLGALTDAKQPRVSLPRFV